MKRKVLFISPSLWMGGTNAALSSIYNSLPPDEFDIWVYIIQNDGDRDTSYKSRIIKRDELLSAYYSNYITKQNFVTIYFVKLIKKICALLHIDLELVLLKRTALKITYLDFDTVVGFMEGRANELASLVRCPRKVGWIQCNYNKYLPLTKSELDIYERFDAIVNVSRYTNGLFVDRYPQLKEKTRAIHHIFDVNYILSCGNQPIDDKSFQTELFTIVSLGRVSKVKRFPTIPSIAKQLKQEGCVFKWYIIGMPSDKEEVDRLNTSITSNSVDDCVRYVGPVENPYSYLAKASLLVSVSESEACPMIFNESKVLGVPIVSTDFPSAFEFIENGREGYISGIQRIHEPISQLIKDSYLYNTIKGQVKYDETENRTIIKEIKEVLL